MTVAAVTSLGLLLLSLVMFALCCLALSLVSWWIWMILKRISTTTGLNEKEMVVLTAFWAEERRKRDERDARSMY